MPPTRGLGFLGRTSECRRPDDILVRARQGSSAVLVIGTNAEIGAQVFLSARTVEWHLNRVFGKLRIDSRDAFEAVLPLEALDRAVPGHVG